MPSSTDRPKAAFREACRRIQDELRDPPKLSPLLALANVNKEWDARPIREDRPPPKDLVRSAIDALIAVEYRTHQLTTRHLKHLLHGLWWDLPDRGSRRLADDSRFVNVYLIDLFNRSKRACHRRHWRFIIEHYDPESQFCKQSLEWLRENRPHLRPRLAKLLEPMGLFSSAPEDRLAQELLLPPLTERKWWADVSQSEKKLLGISPLFSAALTRALVLLQALSPPVRIDLPRELRQTLDAVGIESLTHRKHKADGPLVAAIVSALVAWGKRTGQGRMATDTLLRYLGNPRRGEQAWQPPVAPEDLQQVHIWLNEGSFEAFFEIVDQIQTERPDMWAARKAFWRRYIERLRGAWLLVPPQQSHRAREILGKDGYGRLDGATHTHCALMMEMDGIRMLEMNHNGALYIWSSDDDGLPNLYGNIYRQDFTRMKACRDKSRGRDWINHADGWEYRLDQLLQERTGRKPPPQNRR